MAASVHPSVMAALPFAENPWHLPPGTVARNTQTRSRNWCFTFFTDDISAAMKKLEQKPLRNGVKIIVVAPGE